TKANFGFLAYADRVGIGPSDSEISNNVSPFYPPGNLGNFLLPGIAVSSTQNNLDIVRAAIPNLTPLNGRNIGAAINAAVNQLSTSGGSSDRKAIVLFTAGMPCINGVTDYSMSSVIQ